jgi:hypothetical protein
MRRTTRRGLLPHSATAGVPWRKPPPTQACDPWLDSLGNWAQLVGFATHKPLTLLGKGTPVNQAPHGFEGSSSSSPTSLRSRSEQGCRAGAQRTKAGRVFRELRLGKPRFTTNALQRMTPDQLLSLDEADCPLLERQQARV